MIGVTEATYLLEQNPIPLKHELIDIENANREVLADDILADRDLPPFDRIMMDGIAIQYDSFQSGERSFAIEGIVPAGQPKARLHDPKNALEVMTGAVLPEGSDTVIRYEDLTNENGIATITTSDIKRGSNIHTQGSDHRKGEGLIRSPVRISPAEIGVAATVGMMKISVFRMPHVMIVSTGDELVRIDQKPMDHQIRMSNNFVIEAALTQINCTIDNEHLSDDLESIRNSIRKWMDHYKVIVLSGGSSMGKYDYLPQVLEELQFRCVFHKVRQRPGKPLWFGERNGENFVFVLPGNPVSAFLCLLRYIIPWLEHSAGIKSRIQHATLTNDFSFSPDLTYFLQVNAEMDQSGRYMAHPRVGHGSGDLVNLVGANAFLELPEDREHFKQGDQYPIHFFK